MKKKILSVISVLLAFLVLSSLFVSCIFMYPDDSTSTDKNGQIIKPGESDSVDYSDTFFLIDYIFQNLSIFDVDYETAMLAAIRAYVEATGDKYANYYTPDEYEDMIADNNGDLCGIGVQVVFDYTGYFIEIVMIMPDSPAEKILSVGDKITHISVDGEKVSLSDLVEENKEKLSKIYTAYSDEEINNLACYETFQYASSQIKGEEGTYAEFVIDKNGESVECKIQRAKVTSVTVSAKKSTRDSSVGILYISEFNMTTPTQFKACMDQLISEGCNKFIFDVRNNPGGDLASVVAVLSTLLQKDDVILSTKDNNGVTEITKVKIKNYSESSGYASCSVTNDDIGKYRGYDMVVLANGNSASAAELFTSALRDYELAQIVGVKTYGKGSMQSILSLSNYGSSYVGALKLTTRLYYPPCGEGYDGGIGITPNYEVELEGEAASTNFYKLTEAIDNQLQKAVSVLIDKN